MLLNQFTLPAPDSIARRMVIGWLLLGLVALVIGGLYTVLIVLSRTPFFQEIIPWVDFFRTALVVHVNLTVLVWFLAFSGVFWSYTNSARCRACGWVALGLASLGTLVIVVSPFTGESHPLMNNYVPVLQNPVFFAGLIIFGAGFGLLILRSCLTAFDSDNQTSGETSLRFGLFVAVVASCHLPASGTAALRRPGQPTSWVGGPEARRGDAGRIPAVARGPLPSPGLGYTPAQEACPPWPRPSTKTA